MAHTKIMNIALNRVEGDLEVRLAIEDGTVTDAWSSGIMYRGFERILVGRAAFDALVITPRICGICSTAQLAAACQALEMIAGVEPAPNAVRLRNVLLMTEQLQSDMRHAFLMFSADFANPAYTKNPLFQEAVDRYEPLKGKSAIEAIQETRKVLEIIALIGGQWPHSSYMVPGGITAVPNKSDLVQCRILLSRFRKWYETKILGCDLNRWSEVTSASDLDAWIEEKPSHKESELGFYLRFARSIGLQSIGRGHSNFVSCGSLPLPEGTSVQGRQGSSDHLIPPGFVSGSQIQTFNQEKIAEDVSFAWFRDNGGPKHPFLGDTQPYATGNEGKKYSWAKAPRYDGKPAETGPLAEMIVSENPLFLDLISSHGPNTLIRQLARIVRPALFLPAMEKWISEASQGDSFYNFVEEIDEGEGIGLTHGARGALGHWVKVAGGDIQHYQIITPTAWNASPRDASVTRGPWEEALIGTEIKDPANPLEIGHIVRSFDACLVCAVHVISGKINRPRGIRLC